MLKPPKNHALKITFVNSWSGVFLHNSLDLRLVGWPILLEQVVSISLSRGIRVGIVEEILNAEENLFDGNSWLPTFFLVQDREANCTRGVDVRVKERGNEFA